ncbi:hypothetical protein RUM43_013084 [Polyplax serrata]|uniref:Uncharacterized protein n=1 Tax=Polyplax serrata TaxID=468196 RepID=A0AAN8RZ54_POLSC
MANSSLNSSREEKIVSFEKGKIMGGEINERAGERMKVRERERRGFVLIQRGLWLVNTKNDVDEWEKKKEETGGDDDEMLMMIENAQEKEKQQQQRQNDIYI